ncbi:ROK family transcriptional regulator [Kineococcus sp. NPDC059986]|uniref:ROK family transcriptional regulator n=1 Tax=Kineococcus sp. NPDC059986 TaxID=3155538 RepID=UPI00345011C3
MSDLVPPQWRRAMVSGRPRATVVPAQARAHNRAVLLSLLFHDGPASRADLARTTGLTRVTVSEIVGDLVAEGLVAELGLRPEGRVGKPAMMVGLRSSEHFVLALDLQSLPRIRAAVLDLGGTVVHQEVADLDGRTGDAALDAVEDLAARTLHGSGRTVVGTGVASPGVVDAHGVVRDSANLGWREVHLAQRLGARLGTGVHVANDADAAALAEFTYADASTSGFLLVAIGQGVGAGLVLDGNLVRGHGLAAGEIGHLTVNPRGPQCSCGRRGCLETYLGLPHLQAATAGRTASGRRTALREAGRRLGAVLAPVVAALNLEEVLLTGSDDLLDGPLLEATREFVAGACLPATSGTVRLRMARLGETAVLQGAAALVLSGEFGFS